MPYFPPFANVPDVAVRTKDSKAANTRFVQESLETAGWRLVQVNVTTGSENFLDLVCSSYTSLDVDAVRWRITNLTGGSGLTGRTALMRINDLSNNQAIDSWSSAAIFTDSANASAAYSSFAATWSQGPFAYAANTGINASVVEGDIQAMGLAGRVVGKVREQRIVRNSANTADTFQDVNWSMWSAPNIYSTNRIEQIRFVSNILDLSTGLGGAVNFAANIKWEFFIKVKNS